MAIMRLRSEGLIPFDPPTPTTAKSDVTLIFAFDSGYSLPFKVLLFSLYQAGTMLSCPIRIYSDDPSLRNDPIVAAVADEITVLDDSVQLGIDYLAQNCLKRENRSHWNRGTFLKWRMFEPQATDRVLFLDVDMLCLRPLEPMVEGACTADLAAGPQFNKWIRVEGEAKQTRVEVEIGKTLSEMVQGRYSEGAFARLSRGSRSRLNSGVMLVGNRLLTSNFRTDLISQSKERRDVNEQGLISQYFFKSADYKLRMIPAAYNFQESYLAHVSQSTAAKLMGEICILHYAGRGKPWSASPHSVSRPSFLLWHQFYYHANTSTKLLRGKGGWRRALEALYRRSAPSWWLRQSRR